MRWLDSLFETKSKRMLWVYLIVVISLLLISFANFRLGLSLEKFSDINSFFPLLEYPVVKETFIGRAILFGLDFTNRFSDYQYFFFGVLRTTQWCLGIGSFLLLTAKRENSLYKRVQWAIAINWIVILLQYILIAWNLSAVLSTTNVNLVVNNMQMIGTILKIGSFLNVAGILVGVIIVVQYYLSCEKESI